LLIFYPESKKHELREHIETDLENGPVEVHDSFQSLFKFLVDTVLKREI